MGCNQTRAALEQVPGGGHDVEWKARTAVVRNRESDAQEFIESAAAKTLGSKGHEIGTVVEDYLSTRKDLKASSIETLRFRMAIIEGRTHFPIEVFPWKKAWNERVAGQATDSQLGTRSALQGLLGWALKQRILRRSPELPEVNGRRHKGKDQLRIDEAKRVVVLVLKKADRLAIAIVSMLLTGIRPGEAMALKVRDLDDEGTVCGRGGRRKDRRGETDGGGGARATADVERAGAGASRRRVPFPFKSQKPKTTNLLKSRTDALHRRLRRLCKEAGVPSVVPHSLRGLHSTIATERGSTGRAVADALGHTSFERITEPHYLAPGTADRANAWRVQKVLEPAISRAAGLGGEVASNFTSAPGENASPPTVR
jgi:integrase